MCQVDHPTITLDTALGIYTTVSFKSELRQQGSHNADCGSTDEQNHHAALQIFGSGIARLLISKTISKSFKRLPVVLISNVLAPVARARQCVCRPTAGQGFVHPTYQCNTADENA
jgi:hypothetical protein